MDWANLSDDRLVAFVHGQVQQHDQRHHYWVQKSKLQLAWAAGDQMKVWDEAGRTLEDSLDAQSDRIAIFVNRIKPAVLNWISLVTARPISFRVNPATSDDADVSSASVQDKLVRYYWRKLLGDDVFLDSLWMMFCTGIAFFRSTWDPFAGGEFNISPKDAMTPEEMQESEAASTGIRAGFKKIVAKLSGLKEDDVPLTEAGDFVANPGDIACDFLDGFSIVPPYRATDVMTAPWLVVRQWKHIEEVRSRYGSKADGLNPSFSEPMTSYIGYEGLEGTNSPMGIGVRSPQLNADHVLVYEFWRPRHKTNAKDKGTLAITAQGIVLKKGGNPYDHGEIPIVAIQELPSPKQFWPPSTVQDLMGIQEEINTSRTQVAIHKAATVEPRIIAEKGCGLDDMAFTEQNEIVEVNPGCIDRLRPWTPEKLPDYMVYWEQSLRRDFEDVSRNHAPSYGKQTGSIKSGRHAVALQEADMRMNSPMFRLLRESCGHVARQWLSMLRQFATEERAITIIGENHEPEVVTWSGQQLPESEFNVECDLGAPMDRQSTIELIDMMTARGWLQPGIPQDREMVRRWLGQGVTQEIDETHLDRANAGYENTQMLGGNLAVSSDGDDDTIHLFEHEKEQKSARYRRAIVRDVEIETLFLAHKRAHERQRLQKKIRQQVDAQQIQQELAAEAGLVLPPPQGGGGQRPSPRQGSQPMGGRRASSKPPPPGFKKSNTGNVFVPR